MFRRLFLMLLCVVPMVAMAQTEQVVKWKHSVADKGNGLYTIELKAEIGEGWHIYVTDPAKAFNPTTFEFTPSEGVTAEGDLRSLSKAHIEKDELLMMEIGQYDKEAVFEQDFKAEKGGEVKVKVSYQACNEGSCLSPTDEEFVVTLGEVAPTAEVKAVKDAAGAGSLWSLIIEP